METPTPAYQRFFADLKRRKVFRVMAVYGIVGFGILQVVELAIPALLLPDWTYRLIALLLLVGFPVSVVLAWAFEQTPDGLKRTEPAARAELESIAAAPPLQRWRSGVFALIGLALLAGSWWLGRSGVDVASTDADVATDSSSPEVRLAFAAEERAALPSLAVLPFADMSPEGNREYFTDGITEEILNTIVKIRDLRVVARTSSFAYKGENRDLREVGTELGAQYLLEGSVRTDGEALRITAQLIDAEDGTHLWSETYDRDAGSVFAIQEEIAQAIASELSVTLGLDEDERLVSPTEDLEAYDLYLAGRAGLRRRGEGVREAATLFEAAIARDSGWAPAWAGLAEARTLLYYYEDVERDSAALAALFESAETAAKRALELDPSNASAYVALGSSYRDRWEWAKAEAAYLRALTLDPENVEAHQQYAEYLAYIGRMDEAYRAAQRALALDRSPIRLNVAGYIARFNDRYEEARTLLEEAQAADPELPYPVNNLRFLALQEHDWPAYRAHVLDRLGRLASEGEETAAERAAELQRLWPAGTPPTPEVAEWFADRYSQISAVGMFLWLDDREAALRAMETWRSSKPVRFGDRTGLFASFLDPIRDEPMFREVMASQGLEGRRPKRLASKPATP